MPTAARLPRLSRSGRRGRGAGLRRSAGDPCARTAAACGARAANCVTLPSGSPRWFPAPARLRIRSADGSRTCARSAPTSRISLRRRDTCATASCSSASRPRQITVSAYGVDHSTSGCFDFVEAGPVSGSAASSRTLAARLSRQPDGVEGAAPAARGRRPSCRQARCPSICSARSCAYHGDDSYRQRLEPLARPRRRARSTARSRTTGSRRRSRRSMFSSCPRSGRRTPAGDSGSVPGGRSGGGVPDWRHPGDGGRRTERPSVPAQAMPRISPGPLRDCWTSPDCWTAARRDPARPIDRRRRPVRAKPLPTTSTAEPQRTQSPVSPRSPRPRRLTSTGSPRWC